MDSSPKCTFRESLHPHTEHDWSLSSCEVFHPETILVALAVRLVRKQPEHHEASTFLGHAAQIAARRSASSCGTF
jgi:hypothetical protein